MITGPSQPSSGRGTRSALFSTTARASENPESIAPHTRFHAWARGRPDGPCEPRNAPRLAARLASSQMDGLTAWLPSGASRECRRISARPTRRTRPPARHRSATFRAGEADGITWEFEIGDTIGSDWTRRPDAGAHGWGRPPSRSGRERWIKGLVPLGLRKQTETGRRRCSVPPMVRVSLVSCLPLRGQI